MPESLTLTTPIAPVAPVLTSWKVIRLVIDLATNEPSVLFVARSNTGVIAEAYFTGTAAMTRISAINTANLSLKSLQRLILERMQAEGVLGVGIITGTPD